MWEDSDSHFYHCKPEHDDGVCFVHIKLTDSVKQEYTTILTYSGTGGDTCDRVQKLKDVLPNLASERDGPDFTRDGKALVVLTFRDASPFAILGALERCRHLWPEETAKAQVGVLRMQHESLARQNRPLRHVASLHPRLVPHEFKIMN